MTIALGCRVTWRRKEGVMLPAEVFAVLKKRVQLYNIAIVNLGA